MKAYWSTVDLGVDRSTSSNGKEETKTQHPDYEAFDYIAFERTLEKLLCL